jgi:hypothetical protein
MAYLDPLDKGLEKTLRQGAQGVDVKYRCP